MQDSIEHVRVCGHPSRAAFRVGRLRSLCLAWLVPLALGCASSSPLHQSFVDAQTPNFHVTSSLGEKATRTLIRDLEVFHAGVLAAVGLSGERRDGPRAHVIAFDDRGVSRPFAVRGASAFLLPGIEEPILVIRAPGGFDERIDSDLRHRYAHRILRDRSLERPPLWYEEGRAQLASTLDVAPTGVQIGRAAGEQRAMVLDWRRSDWLSVLGRKNLSGEPLARHRLFEAQAWAVVHALLFDSTRQRAADRTLDPIRRAFESGDLATLERAVAALGPNEALEARIYEHLERKRHHVDRLRVDGRALLDLELRSMPLIESRDLLAGLALEMERPGVARPYFERVLADQPGFAPALAGLAFIAIAEGQDQEVAALLEQAEVASANDALASRRLGMAWLEWAWRAQSLAERQERLGHARARFARSLELDPDAAAAVVGMGRSYIGDATGRDEARPWFERASKRSPGALELNLFRAQLEIALGRSAAATDYLDEVLSRSHSADLRAKAQALLDSLAKRP